MRNISLLFTKTRGAVLLLAALTFFVFGNVSAQDAKEGRTLFKSKCASCHALDRDMIGPALQRVVPTHSEEFLLKWIHDAPALIASGDKEAVEASKFNPNQDMTPFPSLTDDQIKSILAYVKEGEPKPAAGAAGAEGTADKGVTGFSIGIVIGLVAVAVLVLYFLSRSSKLLERAVLQREGRWIDPATLAKLRPDYRKLLKNKKFILFVALCAIICMASFGWMDMWNTGVHTGYQPAQPIKFSHELHVGTNQIDCQYCHVGAFKGKNSTIPSLNICMNCHKSVQARDKYDGQISPEIQKIYNALGYDPDKMSYDPAAAKPIEWVRVHNLPDFAYFNHSQHVVVAEAAIRKAKGLKPNEPVCFACHGPVNTMQEIYQFSPLTMKWCIDCHRETDIKNLGKDNPYYAKIVEMHDRIKKGEKLTPEALGGIECAKCHY